MEFPGQSGNIVQVLPPSNDFYGYVDAPMLAYNMFESRGSIWSEKIFSGIPFDICVQVFPVSVLFQAKGRPFQFW